MSDEDKEQHDRHRDAPFISVSRPAGGLGQDGLHDEQGAVDLGHPAALARGQGVAGGGAAGVPVHAVQPDTAGGLGGDRGQHDGLPAKGAVAVAWPWAACAAGRTGA